MELHQLLRITSSNIPIILLDIDGLEICRVNSKSEISVDLYEYIVLSISIGIPKISQGESYLAVILDK